MGQHRNHHVYTDADDILIRERYRSTRASAQALADMLGTSVSGIKCRAQRIGVSRAGHRGNGAPWTTEEDELLREIYPKLSLAKIKKKLGRSMSSVVARCKVLHLSRKYHDGFFTLREVGQIMGREPYWLRRQIDAGLLKAERNNPDFAPQENGGSYWRISEAAVRDYIRRFPQELIGRGFDVVMVVDLLVGIKLNGYAEKEVESPAVPEMAV